MEGRSETHRVQCAVSPGSLTASNQISTENKDVNPGNLADLCNFLDLASRASIPVRIFTFDLNS
jgi:hypothetical protein